MVINREQKRNTCFHSYFLSIFIFLLCVALSFLKRIETFLRNDRKNNMKNKKKYEDYIFMFSFCKKKNSKNFLFFYFYTQIISLGWWLIFLERNNLTILSIKFYNFNFFLIKKTCLMRRDKFDEDFDNHNNIFEIFKLLCMMVPQP